MATPLISPMLLLMAAIVATVIALVVSRVIERRHREILLNLARQWGMQYSPRDVFNLSARVASHLPVPGASDVRVRDLIYGVEANGGHRCVFRAEYTAGVVCSKTRKFCVVCIVEMLQCAGKAATSEVQGPGEQTLSGNPPATLFQFASEDLSLIEQYESLRPVPTA